MSDLHFASAWEAVADVLPNRPALICGDVSRSWWDFDHRAARLATMLAELGVTPDTKIALYLHNTNEYLEAQYAAFKTRAVPVNVSYRYKAAELVHLLKNCDAQVVFFQACYAMRIWEVYRELENVKAWIQVDDGTESVLEFARDYEQMVRDHAPMARIIRTSNDALMFYSAGTTGMPKAVMWKHGRYLRALFASIESGELTQPTTARAVGEYAKLAAEQRLAPTSLLVSPLMHAASMRLGALVPLSQGGTVVTIAKRSFDPDLVWDEVERLRVTDLALVGDAFAKPLLRAFEDADRRHNGYDIRSLRRIVSSGVSWSATTKSSLLRHHEMALVDVMGSTEGDFGVSTSRADLVVETAVFSANDETRIFAEDGAEVMPGSDGVGRLATSADSADGYYRDRDASTAAFREVDGRRYAFSGDYARWHADGSFALLGPADASVGEGSGRVFAMEVEEAIKRHEEVDDCVVVALKGVLVALVSSEAAARTIDPLDAEDEILPEDALMTFARTQLLDFKLPARIIGVPRVVRLSNGKPDYKWAQRLGGLSV